MKTQLMENGGGVRHGKISAEDVISKLKDDGDYDRLRLKIIRKLKENDELQKNIISKVKQSAVLNRPGVENMKPRQLSDAIHQEVGEKVVSQISNSVWDIIRSGDGMKSEITETVQSVYNKLLNPKGNEDGESSSRADFMPVQRGLETNGSIAAPATKIDGTSFDNEPNEPPGFALSELRQNDNSNCGEQLKEQVGMPVRQDGEVQEDHKGEIHFAPDTLKPDIVEISAPPEFSGVIEHKQPYDENDEDPDVPPGFGWHMKNIWKLMADMTKDNTTVLPEDHVVCRSLQLV